jgi:CheY-like chemotaxis protein
MFRPEVVLCDIGLPGIDGYEVARGLRALPQFDDVLMCALTGFTPGETDRDRPQQAGISHHFVKPLSFGKLTELLATLNEAVATQCKASSCSRSELFGTVEAWQLQARTR